VVRNGKGRYNCKEESSSRVVSSVSVSVRSSIVSIVSSGV
jgi:hypothetical protein